MKTVLSATLALAALATAVAATPSSAAPFQAAQITPVQGDSLIQVKHWKHHHKHGHHGWGYGAAGVAGLAAGALIANSLAQPQVVYAAPPAYGSNWYAYCASRYRSFDPRTGTYVGYDGYRRPCR